MQDNPLEFFRPGRVRGNTAEEKLDRFRQTLQKVVDDSAEDPSEYRSLYAEAHEQLLESITGMDTEEALDHLSGVHESAADNLFTAETMMMLPGTYDAYGRMMVEVEDILNAGASDVSV